MHQARHRAILVLAVVALFSHAAAAQTACKSPSADCVVVGKFNLGVGLGVGQRSNPVHDNSDIPLVVIPQISYYGERFFFENLELGFTLHESDAHAFSLIAAPGYDRVFFYRNDLQNVFVSVFGSLAPTFAPDSAPEPLPLRKRHSTYMAGPEWTFNYGPVIGQVNALYEVTGRHDGYEVRAAIAAPIIQAHSSLTVSAGFTWKSNRLVAYYYGVEPIYDPGAAVNPFIKLGYSRPLSARWTLGAFVHYELLDNAIANSPIIQDERVMTVFAGLMFKIY